MENSDNQSRHGFGLSKNEIIRGYNAYQNVLQNSTIVSSDFIKAFVNLQSTKDSVDFTKSPLFIANVRVGFIIAKKKISSAALRNRIKRLLKEAYRLNKQQFIFPRYYNMILSLTDSGYDHFKKNPKTKLEFVTKEILILKEEIKKRFG